MNTFSAPSSTTPTLQSSAAPHHFFVRLSKASSNFLGSCFNSTLIAPPPDSPIRGEGVSEHQVPPIESIADATGFFRLPRLLRPCQSSADLREGVGFHR